MGLFGLEASVGQDEAVFAEGRVSADLQFTRYPNESGKDKIDLENSNNPTGMVGILLHF